MELTDDILKRFWTKVNKTESCWIWTAAKTKFGHGRFRLYGILESPHVISYILHKGPTNGLWVLHTCDNPSCINPDHLYLGNRCNNMQDCAKRGRMYSQKNPHEFRGENSGRAKFTNLEVENIREVYKEGKVTRKEMAIKYNVSVSAIDDIVNNVTYRI